MTRANGKQAAARRLRAAADWQCPQCFERLGEGQTCGCWGEEVAPTWVDGPVSVHLGDALDVLRRLPAESVDAVVTDPPAGISFMDRTWDHDHGGRNQWIKAMASIFRECLRVLKPGAHGLVWALPRTSHWTATALEDAGFEVREVVHHHFGQGFPKSLDVGRSIDSAVCPEPGRHYWNEAALPKGDKAGPDDHVCAFSSEGDSHRGEGTALKPATEHWILVRRPLAESSVAANVLAHGTGALDVDGCRIHTAGSEAKPYTVTRLKPGATLNATGGNWRPEEGGIEYRGETKAGRWPANLVVSHADRCVPVGTQRIKGNPRSTRGRVVDGGVYGSGQGLNGTATGQQIGYADADGTETVEAWECADGCPVAELDRQSGTLKSGFMAAGTERAGLGYHGALGTTVRNDTIGDSGAASRFFYVAKASARERSAGLPPGRRNTHATVKPVDLMRYLCRLVTPAGGLVLDPFAGSGTTLVAAALEGFRAIGVEQDAESVETARYRVAWALGHPLVPDEPFEPARAEAPAAPSGQLSLLEATP